MMDRKTSLMSLGLCVAATSVMALSAGCTKEEEPPPVAAAPPPPPPPPAKPTVTPIETLMAELNIDPRVELPENAAPPTDEERRAVLVFFDAMARGNAAAFNNMISLADQLELQALQDSGDWKQTTDAIRKIRVQTGQNTLGDSCALAVVEVDHRGGNPFQPQLWTYQTDGDDAQFEAVPAPPGIMDRLSGDWIASWYKILEEEIAMADKPDEEIVLAQQDLDDSDSPSSSGGGGRGPGGGGLRDPGAAPTTPAPVGPEPGGGRPR